ncbi:hypothetical protein [Citromicrobium bathyomarinum]|uniref:hypothetical protein n=1 Tax=Citromicrobium bathyomarinum TaxID=72174 RepID=UPI001E3BABC7|nr:hypothetical protein [Citromicrobium bathyomarinum]MCD1623039.1 hypothetical protein [Citromicrobium bathyomarinum]
MLTIIGACLTAGVVGAFGMAVWLAFVDQHSMAALPNLFALMYFFGVLFAIPGAAIVIAASEFWKFGRWWFFVLAGPLVLFLITLLLNPSMNFSVDGLWPWIAATAMTGATYWLIAWRLYPPEGARTPNDESPVA